MPFLVELAVEPRSRADAGRLGVALSRLAAEDPGFSFSRDSETGQTIIKDQSEPHLEDIVDRISCECATNFGDLQVAYRETLGRRVEVDYTHKQQSGGSGQFARIKLVFEPGSGWGRAEAQMVTAMVPLANTFGYENTLRSMTQRRGSYTIAFDHCAPVPMPSDDDDPPAPDVALRG
jgi:elongation factor G